MVKSENLYRIQNFCSKFLGFCPVIRGDKDELRNILDENGYESRSTGGGLECAN